MHYDDKEILKKNFIEIVICVHSTMGKKNIYKNHEYEITSIQQLKYIMPWDVGVFLRNIDDIKKKLKNYNLTSENFYLIKFKQDIERNFEIITVKNVTNHSNKFYKLH